MKPIRGTLLALALLLTIPPLSGCGDADKYKQTGGIDLTALLSGIAVNESVGFTVTATFPEAAGATGATPINACTVSLEYLAQGGGLDQNWQQVPGTGSTRAFTLSPNEVGTLVVIARGKCVGSTEDWKYSARATVTVGEITGPLTAVNLAANPSTVVWNNPVTFTLTATRAEPCNLRLKYQYSGAGADPPGAVGAVPNGTVRTVYPASSGQFILTPRWVGTMVVTATGWCTQNPKAEVSTTVIVASTDPSAPTITSPSVPSFAAPVTNGVTERFSSGGAVCSNGEIVQYQFTALGSPSETNPSNWSTNSYVDFTWPSSGTSRSVSVQAKCSVSGTASSNVTSVTFDVL